jgi:alcohol dehydrogenase (cytochrome c)
MTVLGLATVLLVVALAVTVLSLLAPQASAQVTSERLLNSSKEPQNWLMYSGDYAGHRYSALDQINSSNVSSLVPKWAYQTMAGGKFEATPLVVDGVLYGTGQDDRVFALDARSGRPIWQYQRALPVDIKPCCGRVNRGLAILGDKVFVATLDAHVIALDSKTGNVVWDVESAGHAKGYSFTLAPLLIKNLVLVGVSGGEYGIRGFIDAYDAATGARKWRFYTIPGPGEPGHETWEGESWKIGGSPAWITGTYDPATNTTFWTTGNPSPSNRGEGRAGDNLYSNSLLALDPDTGKLKWYFQFTQHDEHDYDATQVPVMIDDGDRRLIAQANRNGFFYLLDRTNGKLISATSYAKVTWSISKDATGRPVPDKNAVPTPEGNRVCPGATSLQRHRSLMKRDTRTTAPRIFRTMKRSHFGARCAHSILPREKYSGNGNIPRLRGLACCRLRADWYSPEMPKETSSLSTPRRGRHCGTSSAGRQCIRRPCRLRWTENNTWRSPQGRRSLRLGCPEEGRAWSLSKRKYDLKSS